MPAINALSAASVGDATYTGVMTRTVMSEIRNLFMGTGASGFRPTHIALGIGTTDASIYDTSLDNEIARYPVTQLTQADGVTTALVNLPLTATDIEATEMGVYAGNTLISRANISLSKNSNSIINIIWTLTVEAE